MNLTAIGEKLTDTKLLELAPEFNAKMVSIMDAIGYIQKDATLKGGSFSYKYASAEVVLGKVRDECSKHGISVTNEASLEAFHIVGTKSLAVVKETLYFTDGFFIAKAEGLGSGIDSGDKAVMKGNTSAMKYACSGKFLISWGDDPEADVKTDDDVAHAARLQGRQAVQDNPSEALLDQIELPQEYPDFNTYVSDHGGKRGINELRNVGVEARKKGWTQDELFKWIASQGVVLSDMDLQFSDFAKLNQMIKGA